MLERMRTSSFRIVALTRQQIDVLSIRKTSIHKSLDLWLTHTMRPVSTMVAYFCSVSFARGSEFPKVCSPEPKVFLVASKRVP